MRLNVQNLSFGYGRFPVLKGFHSISFQGDRLSVGHNGSGKAPLFDASIPSFNRRAGKYW